MFSTLLPLFGCDCRTKSDASVGVADLPARWLLVTSSSSPPPPPPLLLCCFCIRIYQLPHTHKSFEKQLRTLPSTASILPSSLKPQIMPSASSSPTRPPSASSSSSRHPSASPTRPPSASNLPRSSTPVAAFLNAQAAKMTPESRCGASALQLFSSIETLRRVTPPISNVHVRVPLKHSNVSEEDSERLMTALSSTPQARPLPLQPSGLQKM